MYGGQLGQRDFSPKVLWEGVIYPVETAAENGTCIIIHFVSSHRNAFCCLITEFPTFFSIYVFPKTRMRINEFPTISQPEKCDCTKSYPFVSGGGGGKEERNDQKRAVCR